MTILILDIISVHGEWNPMGIEHSVSLRNHSILKRSIHIIQLK